MNNFWDNNNLTYKDVILHFFPKEALGDFLDFDKLDKKCYDSDNDFTHDFSFDDCFRKALLKYYNFNGHEEDEIEESGFLIDIVDNLTDFENISELDDFIIDYLDEYIEDC